MTKHLQKQLKQQRHLLHLELPASYGSRFVSKFGKNGIDNNFVDYDDGPLDDCDDEDHKYHMDDIDDRNSLEFGGTFEMGAVPTPASERAKVAVNLFCFYCFLFLLVVNLLIIYFILIYFWILFLLC